MIHRRNNYCVRPGQILVLAILSMTMLVALIFYVYNVGTQVNRRNAMQNQTDAIAISGAGWMARSMNVVAMNNVAQTRMISLALVLDSIPLAAEMTLAEETGQRNLPEALAPYRNPAGPFTAMERDNFYRLGLTELYRQMTPGSSDEDGEYHYDQRQLELIEQLDEAFDSPDERFSEGGFDVRNATAWPDGSIWNAAVGMAQFSEATADAAGILTQMNAVRFGERQGANEAFVTPVLPEFPAQREGSAWRRDFEDFRPVFLDYVEVIDDPMNQRSEQSIEGSNLIAELENSEDIPWDIRRYSSRGGAIPDFEWLERPGPYYHMYRWRDELHSATEEWGYSNWQRYRMGWRSFGPLQHAIRVLRHQFGEPGWYWNRGIRSSRWYWGDDYSTEGWYWGRGSADTTRFISHLRDIADLKLAYLFGLDDPQNVQYSDEWITDYNEAREYYEEHRDEDPSAIMTTRYYRVRVKSTVPPDDSDWMNVYETQSPTATYTPKRWHSYELRRDSDHLSNPRVQPLNRWILDLQGWHDISGWMQVGPTVWMRQSVRQVDFDPELDLLRRYRTDEEGQPILDENGEPTLIPYTVYRVEWRTFGGIELRDEQPVSAPVRRSDVEGRLGPLLLEHASERTEEGYYVDEETGAERQAVRVEPYSLLGVVRRNARSAAWNQRFGSPLPQQRAYTFAQTKIFNPSSWDLWTQDWRTQLAPIRDWSGWSDLMDRGIADADLTVGLVSPALVEDTRDYMDAFEGLLTPDEDGYDTIEYLNH